MKRQTTGVADYFAIVGTGDHLVWKHAQKDAESVDEDELLLKERFLREIVGVKILTINHSSATQPPSEASLPAVSSYLSADDGSASNHNQNPSHTSNPVLPHSPSRSEATSTFPLVPDLPTTEQRGISRHAEWLYVQSTLPGRKSPATDANLLRKQPKQLRLWPPRASPAASFYLAFQPRCVHQDLTLPAVASLQLRYVALPRSLVPGESRGLGHLLKYRASVSDDENVVPLTNYLQLPQGYTEWVVPEMFKQIREPRTPSVFLSHDEGGVETSVSDGRLPQLVSHDEDDPSMLYIPVIAIRFQALGDEERYREDAGIVDVTIGLEDGHGEPMWPDPNFDDEEEDNIFRILGKTKWECATDPGDTRSEEQARRRHGVAVILYRKNLPSGFADAAFATRVLDRFPKRNYKGIPMPEEELPMFCYPTGCRLHRCRFSDAPLPQYYGFVLKNEQGDSIYVSCVSFMEPLTSDKNQQLGALSERRRGTSLAHRRFCEERERKKLSISVLNSDVSTEVSSDALFTSFDEMVTFEKKTICLVGRQPYWTSLRRFLASLHLISGSASPFPLERYISHLISVAPPEPGGPDVLVSFPPLSEPIFFMKPSTKDFPLLDLPLQRLFSCLDVKVVVMVVLGMLALERKIILMSTRPSLVLDICESLRSLLFPFELCAPYVPRLTEPFKSSLNFPGAIFVGIHDDGSVGGLAATVRSEIPEESIVIDVDTGDIQCDGDRVRIITSIWDTIPESDRTSLVAELQTLCEDAGIIDGQEAIDSQYDSAFDVTLKDVVDESGTLDEGKDPLDDRAVRDAFLRFFCSTLAGYERFLVAPDANFLTSGNEWFDAQGFIATVSSTKAQYVSAIVSTQLFQSFIQRRTEASDMHCMLFDECINEFHATSVPYGRLGGDVEKLPSRDGGKLQLLYSLLVDQVAHLGSVRDAASGDIVIRSPSAEGLPAHRQFVYGVEGNPCFPNKLSHDYFHPAEEDVITVEEEEVAGQNSVLFTRSERELEESNRRQRSATTHQGLQSQKRCLWQLPKLMGSHFLGAWLLCIPSLVGQPRLSRAQESSYLARALGAIRLMRSKQRIVPDEAAYRSLMIACGRSGSDRRVELVKLFGLLRSDGIFPSAVTLGQYTKALADGYSKKLTESSPMKDTGEVSDGMSLVDRDSLDVAHRLSALDPYASSLEAYGRRWRQRTLQDRHESTNAEHSGGKKKKTGRSWLPVLYSTSLAPETKDGPAPVDSSLVNLVAMWSRTKACGSCNYIPLDEEVQAGWDVVGGENEVPGAVACPRCSALVVPTLQIRQFTLENALAIPVGNLAEDSEPESEEESLPPQLRARLPSFSECDDIVSVAYISPVSFRRALENYIEKYGESILSRDRLRELDPEVFYNLWWYSSRFSLPLPLQVLASDKSAPSNDIAFVAWEREAAERGCNSAAKVISHYLSSELATLEGLESLSWEQADSFEECPLLSRFNLQGYYANIWDHDALSKVLVALVEACDKRDFLPVLESVIHSTKTRRDILGSTSAEASSTIASTWGKHPDPSDVTGASTFVELDVYCTILYLSRYQCTSAFHNFFPTTIKACKGYHFWCAMGTPLPIFDRLYREASRRLAASSTDSSTAAASHEASDIALGFRCVFGHLI